MNPFRKSPSPLRHRDRERWIRTPETWNKLEELVKRGENTVILGVEGSGKTTLLNMFFNPQYCSQSAASGKLIFFADLSETEDGNDLCCYLIGQLQAAARKHLPETDSAELERTLSGMHQETAKRKFILACECLYDQGYTLLLVMDGFENFVSSPNITQDQHDMLRSLLDKDILRCVVATNYDLEQTSLPKDIQGSLYLQKFQQKITLGGFSLEAATEFVGRCIPAEDPVQLDAKKIKYLHTVTGGIPLLFELSASHMYDLLERHVRIINSEMRTILYAAAKPTIQRWYKCFTPEYHSAIASALAALPGNDAVQQIRIPLADEKTYTAAARLRDRGFWVNGKTNAADTFAFNSLLLQMFASRENMEQAAAGAQPPKTGTAAGKQYNVFISYKRTDHKVETRDAQIAQGIYKALRQMEGIVPFLDREEMPYGCGASDYDETIFAALGSAKAFIYVCTQTDFLSTHWVKTEWKAYTGELSNGRKPEGSIYGVIEGVEPADLPLRLRNNIELFEYTSEDIERLMLFLRNQKGLLTQ